MDLTTSVSGNGLACAAGAGVISKPEDDAVLARCREEAGFFTGSGLLILSRLGAAAGTAPAPWRGGTNIFSLVKEESPPPGAKSFNVFAVSVLDSEVVGAPGFCMAGVAIEKKCLFIADGSEKKRV